MAVLREGQLGFLATTDEILRYGTTIMTGVISSKVLYKQGTSANASFGCGLANAVLVGLEGAEMLVASQAF